MSCRKLLALLLSVVMLVSMLPVAALATQDAGYTAPVAGATDGADGADGADANANDTDNDGNTVDDTDKTGDADDTDKTGGGDDTDKTGDADDTDKTGGGDDTDKTGGGDDTDKTGGADDDTDTSADSTTAGAFDVAPQVAAVPQPVDVPVPAALSDAPTVQANGEEIWLIEQIGTTGTFNQTSYNGISTTHRCYLGIKDGQTITLDNLTIDFSNVNATNQVSPVMVAENANATLIIKGTVELHGLNASDTRGATPAIYVPESSTLTIISAHETRQDADGNALSAPVDTLKVYGGNAAAGGDGGDGTLYETLKGGAGGNGGGGAAPAIGGNGGTGGAGGAGTVTTADGGSIGIKQKRLCKGHFEVSTDKTTVTYNAEAKSDVLCIWNLREDDPLGMYSWTTASSGQAGVQGGTAGDIRLVGYLTLEGSGGDAAAGGKGGKGSEAFVKERWYYSSATDDNSPDYVKNAGFAIYTTDSESVGDTLNGGLSARIAVGGVGGGGGGGGGCAAPFIGNGGAGGSGGSSGTFGKGIPTTGDTLNNCGYGFGLENSYNSEAAACNGGAGGDGGWPNGGGGAGGNAAYLNTAVNSTDTGNANIYYYWGTNGEGGTSDQPASSGAVAASAGAIGKNGTAGNQTYTVSSGDDYKEKNGELGGLPIGGAAGKGANGISAAMPTGSTAGGAVNASAWSKTPIFSTAVQVTDEGATAGKTGNTAYHSVLVGSGDGYQSGSVTQPSPILLVDLKDVTFNHRRNCGCGSTHEYKWNGYYSLNSRCHGYYWPDGTATSDIATYPTATVSATTANKLLDKLNISTADVTFYGGKYATLDESTYPASKCFVKDEAFDDRHPPEGTFRWKAEKYYSETADSATIAGDVAANESAGAIVLTGYWEETFTIEKSIVSRIHPYDDFWNKEEVSFPSINLGGSVEAKFTVQAVEKTANENGAYTILKTSCDTEAIIAGETDWINEIYKGCTVSWVVTLNGENATENTDYVMQTEDGKQYFKPLKAGVYKLYCNLLNMDYLEDATAETLNTYYPYTITVTQTVTPTITGTPHAGQTLTATLPDEVLAALETDGITVNYRWYDVTTEGDNQITAATEISGATAKTYTVPHNCADGKVAVTVELTGDADKPPYYQEDTSAPIAVTAHNYPKASNGKSESGFCTVEVGTSTDTDGNTTLILCDEYEMPEFTTAKDRYKIENGGQLFWFAALTNGDSTHAHMKDGTPVSQNLAANAQIAGNKGYYKSMIGRLWTPIAKDAKVESGTLTGGYTGTIELISNIGLLNVNIDYSEATSDTAPQCVGFIAALGSGGMVKVPSDSSTNNSTTIAKSVKARNSTYVGGLVGYAAAGSTIQFLDGTPMQNKFEITADNCGYVGGVVGYSAGTLTNANFAGKIAATNGSKNIGGVVGYADGATITSPSYTGVITVNGGSENIGGIVGYSNGATITDATATGVETQSSEDSWQSQAATGTIAVNGTGESAKCEEVGGIVGYATGATNIIDATSSVQITGSYLSHVGGVLGAGRGGSVQLSGCLYNRFESLYGIGIYAANTWDSVGGIAGVLEGTMVNSANRGYLIVEAGSGSSGDGGVYVGGLAGQTGTGGTAGSKITDCYSWGFIDVQTTATGANRAIGALIGRCYNRNNGGCFNSYYREDTLYLYGVDSEETYEVLNQAIGVLNSATCPDTNLSYAPCRAEGGDTYDEETGESTGFVKGGFSGGEVTYLLNGEKSSSVTNVWFQNIDNGWVNCIKVDNGEPCSDHEKDDYPRLAREFTRTSDHGLSMYESSTESAADAVVYKNNDADAPSGYSNYPPMYKVMVTWGSMVFDYELGDWNPDEHTYGGDGWVNEYTDGRNLITVANVGAAKIKASFTFTAESSFMDYHLAGTFKPDYDNEANSGSFSTSVSLEGVPSFKLKSNQTAVMKMALSSDQLSPDALKSNESTKVGTVTVTVQKDLVDE